LRSASSSASPTEQVAWAAPLAAPPSHLARWGHAYLAVGTVLGVLALWELAADLRLVSPILFPPPSKVAAALVWLVGQDYFPKHVRATAYETAVGFAIGVVVGLAAGAILALVPAVRHTLYPYVVAFQALPKIVFAPLFVTLFGFGPESKIATAATICFFPLMLNTTVGLTLVDPEALKLMRSLRASQWQILTKLRFPNALPHVFAGLQTSVTFAITGALVAEIVTGGGSEGLGRLTDLFGSQLDTDRQFAVVLIVSLIGVAAVMAAEWLDRRVVFWRE
jgi:NitT/TauT family transport system permease protein